MASSPPPYTNGLTLILPNHDQNTLYSTPIFRPSARRTVSFSSESSSESLFSSNEDSYPPYSPNTPLKLIGIPFSWEKIPGIPKRQESKKKEYSEHLLPPPPARNSAAAKKSHRHSTNVRSLQRDPFFEALVECSKDDHHNHDHGINMISSKITRTLSDRLGLINSYVASCKRNCSVSESIVCIPRSSSHYLVHNRR
ncbi:hypothetical protein CASFOL_012629 [Castilleja foliolosa]|uniref:Uncharacterized protein n=1 Tax=Castilleja foliolosa TaxID=1961234 RepID=A0ABD3DLE6_9LAMI